MTAQSFCNGKVFTGRSETDFVSAFLVENGRIAWVGDASESQGGIDLHGRTVVPGFIDAHTHPSLVALNLDAVLCAPPGVNSIEDMIEALRRSPRGDRGDSVWIEGRGYDESLLAEGRSPTRRDLDRVSTTQPVYVQRSDCHSGACNSRALQLAGITRTTPDPPGARFGRSDDGEPNGVLLEIAANEAVLRMKPALTHRDHVGRLVRLSRHYSERGIVAVTDMMAAVEPYDALRLFRDARDEGFKQQAVIYYDWRGLAAVAHGDLAVDAREGAVRVGGVKLFADGTVSGRTAWLGQPYRDSDDCGLAAMTDDDVNAAYDYVRRNRVQLACHAMGDRATQQVIERFADEEPWLEAMPSVRIEHASLITRDQIQRLRHCRMRFGIATQIIFLYAEHAAYAANLSHGLLDSAYPMRDLYENVEDLALSSDAPATTWADPDNVFDSLKAAATRKAHSGADIVPEQAISVPQALLLYTGRARRVASFSDLGRIAPGYRASFAILDRDVFAIAPEQLDEVRVAETYVDGELVFTGA